VFERLVNNNSIHELKELSLQRLYSEVERYLAEFNINKAESLLLLYFFFKMHNFHIHYSKASVNIKTIISAGIGYCVQKSPKEKGEIVSKLGEPIILEKLRYIFQRISDFSLDDDPIYKVIDKIITDKGQLGEYITRRIFMRTEGLLANFFNFTDLGIPSTSFLNTATFGTVQCCGSQSELGLDGFKYLTKDTIKNRKFSVIPPNKANIDLCVPVKACPPRTY